MKKALLILPVILFLFFESCRNDFSINAPNQDFYVLNCILQNNDSVQYAIISKNVYTANGASPTSNSTAQNIKGANVEIYYNDSVFVMKDTTIELTNSGSVTQVNCYYIKNLVLQPGTVVRMEATVSQGEKLESTIQIPKISFTKFSSTFPQSFQSGYITIPNYSWSWIGNTEDMTNILNLPQLEIYYKKYGGGTFIDKKIDVPLALYFTSDENSNLIPVNAGLSFNNYCMTTLETVNKTMQKISGNDPDKKDYIVTKVLFSVTGLSPDLAKYYSAYNTYNEDFSIKLRQTDYSNIEGGKGIFGAYYKFSKPLTVDSFYIKSFGYQYRPEYTPISRSIK